MDALHLAARVNAGNGRAAKCLGTTAWHHRATDPHSPLKTPPLQKLLASFITDYGYMRTARFGQAGRIGIFDATRFRPGDFLVSPTEGVFYVAAMPPLQPVLCVKAERRVTLLRTALHGTSAGIQEYGGTTAEKEQVIMTDWPASILSGRGSEHSPLRLPGETRCAWYSILMPFFNGVLIHTGDFVADDTAQRYVITGTELTEMGWRLAAMRVTV